MGASVSDRAEDGTSLVSEATVVYLPRCKCESQEGDVERINQFSFYELGRALKQLSSYVAPTSPQVCMYDLLTVRNSLKSLLEGKPIPIGFSRAATVALQGAIDQIVQSHFEEKNAAGETTFHFPVPEDPPIPEWRFNYFRHLLATFETIFEEEMREATTYFVPRRGIYWTPALVDAADETFPTDLRPHIPEKTRVDWRSAGRCLAFNLLSASGFHVARAVEGILESYYQLFSGKPDATLVSWAAYLKALEGFASQTPAPTEKTLAELRQMKDDYRNPVVHPRVVLSESDARMLYANGESLIIAMAQEIQSAAASGLQLALVPPAVLGTP